MTKIRQTKDRLLEKCKSTGVNLEATLPPQESRDKGKETKMAGKALQEEKTFHKRGNFFLLRQKARKHPSNPRKRRSRSYHTLKRIR